MKKHVALSRKSLDKIWVWCEENDGTPLAAAYVGACSAVSALDCSDIADQLKPTWNKRASHVVESFKLYDPAFKYRDMVGRMILDLMKRED